ncbi:MAG: phenylalanine--tRNA ligase subunit alpha [Legionellales bacterium]|nr:phenylalanine--tRNA ligase subunit alpha [Legionellales bacterium]|tara:strand:- start:963 stop:1988 length:1026 start_codon:yes stop_codon:yes gene_type:complete
MSDIQALLAEALEALEGAQTSNDVVQIKSQYLGKKGKLSDLMKSLKSLPTDERPAFGQKVNEAKQALETKLLEKSEALNQQAINLQLQKETCDVTLAPRGDTCGGLHPVTKTMHRMISLFEQMGFSVATGPEIETDFYNFEALNFPPDHPARAMQDTFYLPDGHLLRTHTSPVQIRHLENHQPPVRIVAPGRVFRCDSDVTHTPMFHQIEGLWVDETISFAALKGFLADFMEQFFEQSLKVRFRPSFFPFVEPGAEMDITCTHCQGAGCRICKGSGWLEVLGCGMVHPNVLKAVNIDTEKYQGFAFGMGVDRMTMLRYHISDLRSLFENDSRFLKAFSFGS